MILILLQSHISPETLLGMEVNQDNGSNATDSMLDEDSSSTGCSSNDCRHHTYDTLTRQLRGGGEVFLLNWSLTITFQRSFC